MPDDALVGLSAEDMITNWSAYISSYSGKLWPRSTIEHWVNATVDRFLDMRPKRMLELGSGNGMLAFRAALRPEVEEVWMADLSGEACRYLEAVASHPHFAHIKHKVRVRSTLTRTLTLTLTLTLPLPLPLPLTLTLTR